MSEAEQHKSDLEALRGLDADSQDLEQLEALLDQFIDQFNIFEATGFAIKGEERHSNLLAFLMNPRQKHGMGDAFVKRFLQQALEQTSRASELITPTELGLWDLGQMQVAREWWRIDVLLLDERKRLAVIIENKIRAPERRGQLERYHKVIREKYPDYKLVAIFLTSNERMPSHEAYLPLGYGTVCEVLDELGSGQSVTLEPDVRTLITHYAMMLRRHIVGDFRIAKLSQEIYQKHKRAIDMIVEHRPNTQAEIGDLLVNLIKDDDQLVYKGSSNKYTHFRSRGWEGVATLNSGKGANFFRFVFHKNSNELDLFLESSPGDKETSQRLFEMGQKNKELFNHLEDPATHGYPKIFRRQFLTPNFYQEATSEEREAEILKNWDDFLENDLPRIEDALKQERWLWEPSDDEIEDAPDRSERFG